MWKKTIEEGERNCDKYQEDKSFTCYQQKYNKKNFKESRKLE